ncbi:hypothetical protein [Microbacterium oxydans]|uniref:DUF998 domain-containing protein n=1 Tax=Microbacterium oxydans TaxID=82380 RepID=A0A0F0L9G9_9MICO|nr:hypothetical protein [Microbacterium oxydans]KJL29842.1 hypothetical protein RS83_01413 [Microbacterium oxydans]
MTVAAVDPATTGQKTHRYLRLSLVFVVVALLASVAIEMVVVSWDPFMLGWNPLPSISHAFYTPVRSVFVGALIATSLAMLALSGRGREAILLDIAAVFAPLIAIVPTGIAPEHPIGDLRCPGTDDCIPTGYIGEVRAGVAIYVVVVLLVVVTMAAVRAKKQIVTPGAALVSGIAVLAAVVVAALAFIPGLNADFPFNFWPYPPSIHFLVTLLFFGTFVAVPVLHSRGPVDETETPPTPRQRSIYRWVARLLIADLLLLLAAFIFRDELGTFPLVLIGEAVALSLFAWFWWVQTFQRWDDANPPTLL